MEDLCFQGWNHRGCGLAPGGCAQPAGGGAWPCFPHCGHSSELRAGGREAGHGWVPDGLSGLPRVDSEAPLVSAAPSALIRLCGGSLLWNASETQPASPRLPLTPSASEIAPFLPAPSLLPQYTPCPQRQKGLELGTLPMAGDPPIWDLSPIFP